MDRFVVWSILLCILISSLIIAGSYIGHYRGSLEGTDDVVEHLAEIHSHAKAVTLLPAIPEDLEPVGFTIAGMVGGFLVGYFWEDLLRREEKI